MGTSWEKLKLDGMIQTLPNEVKLSACGIFEQCFSFASCNFLSRQVEEFHKLSEPVDV